MPRTIETVVYEFSELSDKAKQKAIDACRDWNVDHDWWDFMYDDCKNIGVKIGGFDLGRSWSIDLELQGTVGETVQSILSDHGKMCDTYKLAQDYFRQKHIGSPMDCAEFSKQLGKCYLKMLQSEYEHLTGDESIAESLEINDVEFLENGKPI